MIHDNFLLIKNAKNGLISLVTLLNTVTQAKIILAKFRHPLIAFQPQHRRLVMTCLTVHQRILEIH